MIEQEKSQVKQKSTPETKKKVDEIMNKFNIQRAIQSLIDGESKNNFWQLRVKSQKKT